MHTTAKLCPIFLSVFLDVCIMKITMHSLSSQNLLQTPRKFLIIKIVLWISLLRDANFDSSSAFFLFLYELTQLASYLQSRHIALVCLLTYQHPLHSTDLCCFLLELTWLFTLCNLNFWVMWPDTLWWTHSDDWLTLTSLCSTVLGFVVNSMLLVHYLCVCQCTA